MNRKEIEISLLASDVTKVGDEGDSTPETGVPRGSQTIESNGRLVVCLFNAPQSPSVWVVCCDKKHKSVSIKKYNLERVPLGFQTIESNRCLVVCLVNAHQSPSIWIICCDKKHKSV
ncbi:hypothetical protein J6590_066268 [Homalodisca vitripennis]|nr:hypothetical protein J6590_066268 [Homalodisca vitripennis]